MLSFICTHKLLLALGPGHHLEFLVNMVEFWSEKYIMMSSKTMHAVDHM